VAFADVDALDRDPPFFWQDFDYFAPFAFVIAMPADDFNNVTFTNFKLHS
jgi:hypothetical protein